MTVDTSISSDITTLARCSISWMIDQMYVLVCQAGVHVSGLQLAGMHLTLGLGSST